METQMLTELTLDAVKAESIAHHLRRGYVSHFSDSVQWPMRLAVLGEQMQVIFNEALVNRAAGSDTTVLQKNLLSLAATALIWVEVLEKHERCTCPWTRAIDWETVKINGHMDPCPAHPDRLIAGYHKEGSKPSDIPKA